MIADAEEPVIVVVPVGLIVNVFEELAPINALMVIGNVSDVE